MKALTLTQPWATAVAMGVKKVETRSWATGFRGYFAIHAAKGWELDDREFAQFEAVRWTRLKVEEYPRGAIVATAKLVRVAPADAVDVSDVERVFGYFEAGRFAWFLEDVVAFKVPVPCKGAQGWWDVPAEVEVAMREQRGLVVPA